MKMKGEREILILQDAVELASKLQNAVKSCGGTFKETTSDAIENALRAFELKRAPRTHDMVSLARYNVSLICTRRTWPVGAHMHFQRRYGLHADDPRLLGTIARCCESPLDFALMKRWC